jgi:hypothetical protein
MPSAETAFKKITMMKRIAGTKGHIVAKTSLDLLFRYAVLDASEAVSYWE